MIRTIWLVLAASSTCLFGSSLTFTGNVCSTSADGTGALVGCPNGAYINQAYGDTAGVDFTYAAMGAVTTTLQLWGDPGVYSDLPKAAYGYFGANSGSITMQALGGSQVTLDSFAIGTSPPAFSRTAAISIVDLATNLVVFSTGSISVGGATATPFTPNLTSAVGLRLTVSGDLFNVGIGNFNFTETAAPPPPTGEVPEPATWALAAAGLAALAMRHRINARCR